MTPIITAFENSPDRGQGLARDMRVRWAFEEVGARYDVRLVSFAELKTPDYRALQPFAQIPAYQAGALTLFETGAIVLHIAHQHPGLLPDDPAARERAVAWLFAALNTVEPPIVERSMALVLEADQPWHDARLPMLDKRVRTRLTELATHLGDSEWLDGAFSVGDLMMITVLMRVKGPLLDAHPALTAYVARGERRPAFRRAFDAQLEVYQASNAAD